MHVHQCKNAKHNERILLDQSPQEATIVVSSTHVQRLSGRGRSAALVSRLNLAWKQIFVNTQFLVQLSDSACPLQVESKSQDQIGVTRNSQACSNRCATNMLRSFNILSED